MLPRAGGEIIHHTHFFAAPAFNEIGPDEPSAAGNKIKGYFYSFKFSLGCLIFLRFFGLLSI